MTSNSHLDDFEYNDQKKARMEENIRGLVLQFIGLFNSNDMFFICSNRYKDEGILLLVATLKYKL